MAERRVSVRLVATGAQAFRAELRGIGTDGARALGLIEAAGPRAAAGIGTASAATGEAARQMDQIAARAAGAAEVLRRLGTDSGSVAERIDRLVGATGRVSRSAEDIETYGRSLDDLRARFNPVFAEMRRHGDQVREIERAHRVGAISSDELTAAIERSRAAMAASIGAIRAREAALADLSGRQDVAAQIDASTGVSGRTARDAADIEAYGRALDDLRARFNPVFAEMRRHGDQVREIERAHRVGAISSDELTAAIERSRAAMAASIGAIRAREAALGGLSARQDVRARIDSATGVSGGTTRDAADIAAYGNALDDMRAKFNPAFATIRNYRRALEEIRQAHRTGAISADEMTAAISRERQAALGSLAALRGRTQAIEATGRATGLAVFRMQNLSYQIQDIGVSLAGGMNPFTVLAQQGSQIAQIYGFGGGGVNGLMRDLGGMATTVGRSLLGVVRAFPLISAGVTLATGAIALMRREIVATTGEQVSFGTVARAAWQVFAENVYAIGRPVFDTIRSWWDNAVAWADWAFEGIVDSAIWMGDLVINAFKVAAAGATYAFQGLPDAVGALAVGAANAVIRAVDFMIERAVSGINALMEAANAALEGVGLDPAFDPIDPSTFRIGELDNPYADRDAERRAELAARIREIVGGSPLSEYFDDVRDRALRIRVTPEEPATGGGAGRSAGDDIAEAAETAARGWEAVTEALARYAEESMNWGKAIGDSLVGAFSRAEDAFGEWVTTGRLDFRELTNSIIADLARIAFRRFVLGPVANALSGIFSGPVFGAIGEALGGSKLHTGGMAGGGVPVMIGAAELARAPRLHSGGGWLGPDEYPAILQRGERVLNRGQTRDWESGGGTQVHIHARDAESFRASRAQVAADIARAVAYGRRSS